jgi:hypothetical protein
MKRLIAFLFVLIAANAASAQDEVTADSSAYTFEIDSTGYSYDESESQPLSPSIDPQDATNTAEYKKEDVRASNFDRDKWKKIVGDQTFEEHPPEVEPKEPPKKSEGWKFPRFGAEFFRTASFIAIFLIFGFILYYVATNTKIKRKIKPVKLPDITAPVENIEEVDSDALLKHALAGGDLRLAVRIYFLLLLKKLNEVGLISWKKDKTNRDYLSELYGREPMYEDVRKLTLTYELVWYGERSVSEESFQHFRADFESASKNLESVNTTA